MKQGVDCLRIVIENIGRSGNFLFVDPNICRRVI